MLSQRGLEASSLILTAIVGAQARLFDDADPGSAFAAVLDAVLAVAACPRGLIAKHRRDPDGASYWRIEASRDGSDDEASRAAFAAWSDSLVSVPPPPGGLPADAEGLGVMPPAHTGASDQRTTTAFFGFPLVRDGSVAGLLVVAGFGRERAEAIEELLAPSLAPLAAFLATAGSLRRRRVEQRERDSLVALAEASGNLIAWADLDGTLRYLNPAGRRLLGLAPDVPAAHLHIRDCHPEETGVRNLSIVVPHVLACGHWEGESDFLNRTTGARVPTWQEVFLVRTTTGEPRGLATIARDITELKRVNDALRLSEEKFATAFRTAPDAIGLSRLSDGRYVDVNDGFVLMHGWTREETIGRTSIELGVWDDLEERSRLGALVRAAGEVQGEPVRLRRKDGTTFTAMASARLVTVGGETCVLHVSRDITKQLRVEAALRDSESRHREAQRTAHLGHWDFDLGDDRPRWSEETFRIFDLDPAQGVPDAETFMSRIHPDDRALLDSTWEAAFREGESFVLEHRISTPATPLRFVEVRGVPHRDASGRYTRLSGTVMDISERKRAENALRELAATLEARVRAEVARNREKDHLLIQQSRLAAMGEMIGNIAHQWRQPLNALGLLLSNLRDAREFGELNAEYFDAQIERGNRLVQSMSTTIEDFRNFFKPNRDRQPFSLAAVVREAVSMVETAFAHGSITLEVSVHEDATVVGFANEYVQVLLNLLSNAKQSIEARQRGAGRVRLVVERTDGTARVTVQDNGCGVPAEVLPRVFDPYFTTRESGTGIGLYMSKMIIETNMDGTIELRNAVDGAEVVIVTPVAREATTVR